MVTTLSPLVSNRAQPAAAVRPPTPLGRPLAVMGASNVA
jgi:hypothetical protein